MPLISFRMNTANKQAELRKFNLLILKGYQKYNNNNNNNKGYQKNNNKNNNRRVLLSGFEINFPLPSRYMSLPEILMKFI